MGVSLPMGKLEPPGFPWLQQRIGAGCQMLELCSRHPLFDQVTRLDAFSALSSFVA